MKIYVLGAQFCCQIFCALWLENLDIIGMITGHQAQWNLLRRMAANGKMPQALLFSGEESLGKKRIALEFIKLLNCERTVKPPKETSKEPCQSCFACRLIEKGQHPDIIIVKPEKKEIQIDQIRELKKHLNLRPQLASFKAVIIDDAHALNSEAQNCFLKTLEEPQGKTLFILIASYPEMLFPTIRSRCEALKFYRVSFETLEKSLKQEFGDALTQEIVLISEGKPGKALNFLRDPKDFSLELKAIKEVESLFRKGLTENFSFAKEFFEGEAPEGALNYFLEVFIRCLRTVFLKKLGVDNKGLKSAEMEGMSFDSWPLLRIKNLISAAERLRFLSLTTNVNQRLVLESLLLNL